MKKITLPLALFVAAAFSARPALAQNGHGHGHGNGHDHEQSARRDDDGDDNGRYDNGNSRYQRNASQYRLERRVPPGWCQGRGNPHNTVANCGPGSNRYDRRYDPQYNGRYNTGYGYPNSGRYNTGYGTNGRYNNGYPNGAYGNNNRQAYAQWKQYHDQQCHALERQRPLDLRWQMQVRQQCSAEDRTARQRYGV